LMSFPAPRSVGSAPMDSRCTSSPSEDRFLGGKPPAGDDSKVRGDVALAASLTRPADGLPIALPPSLLSAHPWNLVNAIVLHIDGGKK
jgi:hypothetical protein